MKHAGSQALDALDELLTELRKRPQLRERKRGVFYRKTRAWLHFHEDPAGLFADLKDDAEWLRFDVSGEAGRADLLRRLDAQGGV
jgi:hypothetical protein